MDNILRNCILLSAFIHSAIFAPLMNPDTISAKSKRSDVTVDYVVLKEPVKAEKPKVQIEVRAIETPKVEIKEKVELKTAPSSLSQNKTDVQKVAEAEVAKKEARLRSTSDYVNYYQLIREKVRARLKEHYSRYYREGDVALSFTISSNGALIDSEADMGASVNDKELVDIALKSLKESSPFPKFPKQLSLPKMSFNLVVSFKKK